MKPLKLSLQAFGPFASREEVDFALLPPGALFLISGNDNDKDHLEIEIVKGDQSYEVMVDFDSATRKSTEVDVETNIWEAERTEKVKGDE